MKNSKFSLIAITAMIFLYSCVKKDNAPPASANILAYTIKEIPVTQDYTIGAFYYNFGTFNSNISEVPAVGKYAMPNGVVPPAVMTKHIEYAGKGGIDYFLFQFRSANRDLNNYKSDSAVVKSFLDV